MGTYQELAIELKNQVIKELNQTLAEKDREIAHLKEKVARYDRWLSKGVYYTNDEFFEKILKPKQQLMEQAVLFAKATISDMVTEGTIKKAQAFLKERETNGSH